MIVADASAILAIYLNEPERDAFRERLEAEDEIVISPINYWEAVVRAHSIDETAGAIEVETLMNDLGVKIAVVDGDVAKLAVQALIRFGRPPARLNLGDCFAYALAKSSEAPLLFKGNDFAATDVEQA